MTPPVTKLEDRFMKLVAGFEFELPEYRLSSISVWCASRARHYCCLERAFDLRFTVLPEDPVARFSVISRFWAEVSPY